MNPAPSIWIDLDNAPHAHFFAPLISDLRDHGYHPLISIRAFGQTEGLARSYGMDFTVIGTHVPQSSRAGRVCETLARAARLVEFGAAHRPIAAVSHGSRSLTLAAAALSIPSMALYDYEHVSASVFRFCRRVLVPEIVLRNRAPGDDRVGYPGFKEDVYVSGFRPDPAVLQKLGLDPDRLIVSVRPPATWAHYHSDDSTTLFRALVEHLRAFSDAQIVVLARTQEQAAELARDFVLDTPPFLLTSEAVDGLGLLSHSDATFSGGGTMVREAALLGVDAYSTFAGRPGAVDLELERLGKLTMLRSVDEIANLRLRKRPRTADHPRASVTRTFILQQILELAAKG
jgi:predicted glycosyltransferase